MTRHSRERKPRIVDSIRDLDCALLEMHRARAELDTVGEEPDAEIARMRAMADPLSRLGLAWRYLRGVLRRHGWREDEK